MSRHEDLREALVEDLITRIRDGETVVTKEGPVQARCPSGVLAVAVQYLKTFADKDEGDLKAAEISETLAQYAGKMRYGARN